MISTPFATPNMGRHYAEKISPGKTYRVALAEPNRLMGEVISHWMMQLPFVREVEAVTDYAKLSELIHATSPAMVILSDRFGGVNAVANLAAARRQAPTAALVYMAHQLADQQLVDLLQIHPNAIVSGDCTPEDFASILQDVVNGYNRNSLSIDKQVQKLGEERMAAGKRGRTGLSLRQKEVLRYLALGHTVKEVAAIMHLSVKSVDSHKYRIMKKLDLHDRVHLARYAIREGLLEA